MLSATISRVNMNHKKTEMSLHKAKPKEIIANSQDPCQIVRVYSLVRTFIVYRSDSADSNAYSKNSEKQKKRKRTKNPTLD